MDYFHYLVSKYLNKGIILDTNLLLLYLIGLFNPALIQKFKRTDKYSNEDFVITGNFVSKFNHVIITPHILAELSSLSKDLPDTYLYSYFEVVIKTLSPYTERNISKDIIFQNPLLSRIGVTDVAIHQLSSDTAYLVFTDDMRLTSFLQNSGVDVINLNHIRTILWLK